MYIPLMLVASLGVAYLLSRQRPGITAFRIIYYIPVLTSWVAASMIWKSMLSPEYGAVNNILAVFGIQEMCIRDRYRDSHLRCGRRGPGRRHPPGPAHFAH